MHPKSENSPPYFMELPKGFRATAYPDMYKIQLVVGIKDFVITFNFQLPYSRAWWKKGTQFPDPWDPFQYLGPRRTLGTLIIFLGPT